ncbi:MAG: rhomboid family intramembrane serine protease [Oscillospiraceae bacterium]|nr:rhomboid family intramembrane serine protease [Oscillospiraceae bacterium]
MTILVFGMALVFLLDTFTAANPNYEYYLTDLLYFDRAAIMQGQVWRIVTFLFLPPDSSPLFVVFALYFYWLIGKSLEHQWGSFRFNVYYFIGVIGTIIGGIITGMTTNTYLNLSLFLAFAMLFPNFEVLLFFFIPVKIKFLGMLDGALLLFSLILGTVPEKIAILVSVLNFILFFGKDLINKIKMALRRKKQQKQNHWWKDDQNNPWKK